MYSCTNVFDALRYGALKAVFYLMDTEVDEQWTLPIGFGAAAVVKGG